MPDVYRSVHVFALPSYREGLSLVLAEAAAGQPVPAALQQRIDELLGSVSLADLLREEATVEQFVTLERSVTLR